jgi:hypothetical protein
MIATIGKDLVEHPMNCGPDRKKLTDINGTDEPGTEDWGRQGRIIRKE